MKQKLITSTTLYLAKRQAKMYGHESIQKYYSTLIERDPHGTLCIVSTHSFFPGFKIIKYTINPKNITMNDVDKILSTLSQNQSKNLISVVFNCEHAPA